MLFAESDPTFLAKLLGGYIALMLGACVAAWFWVAQRARVTGWLLPQNETPLPQWGVLDIAVLIALWIGSQVGGQALAAWLAGFPLQAGEISKLTTLQQAKLIGTIAGMQWLAMGVYVGWLRYVLGVTWKDLGLGGGGLGRDLLIGCFGFLLITPPVMMLQALLGALYPEQKHPFIEAMSRGAGAPLIASIVFAAVLTAPWVEELMFRVVIMSWFERIFSIWDPAPKTEPAILDRPDDQAVPTDSVDDAQLTERTADGGMLEDKPPPTTIGSDWEPVSRWRMLPIVLSSLLFALVHFGHGPAPISLFFFALGLGYIYQRTRRLIPCIVIHALLNGQTSLFLVLTSLYETP